jgi:hypothetical protein
MSKTMTMINERMTENKVLDDAVRSMIHLHTQELTEEEKTLDNWLKEHSAKAPLYWPVRLLKVEVDRYSLINPDTLSVVFGWNNITLNEAWEVRDSPEKDIIKWENSLTQEANFLDQTMTLYPEIEPDWIERWTERSHQLKQIIGMSWTQYWSNYDLVDRHSWHHWGRGFFFGSVAVFVILSGREVLNKRFDLSHFIGGAAGVGIVAIGVSGALRADLKVVEQELREGKGI